MFADPMQTLRAIVINKSVNLALVPGMCCPHSLPSVMSVERSSGVDGMGCCSSPIVLPSPIYD
jgi:hypothetical protein